MKIKYETLAFLQAIEMKRGTMTSATSKEFDIELDTDTNLITLTDLGTTRYGEVGDQVQTTVFNMKLGRLLKSKPLNETRALSITEMNSIYLSGDPDKTQEEVEKMTENLAARKVGRPAKNKN